ncbi:MAG TPA: Fn3-like domain-containing protein [Sphingobacteriaceae bacterium]
MMKTLNSGLRAGLCLIIALLFTNQTYAQRINVNPTILNYNAPSGGSAVQLITLTNLSDQDQTYQLSLGDWRRDSVGGHQYFAPGTTGRSCAPWITFDNPTVSVAAGKSKEVRVTLNAPQAAAPDEMKWAMIFIQNVVEQNGGAGKNAKMAATIKEVYRIGVHVYQTPPEANIKAAKAISLERDKTEANAYNFTMNNTGKSMLECKVRLVLTNLADGSEIKLDESEFPVFPDGHRILKLTVPNTVPKGKYSMLAILDYDPDMPLEAIEKPLEIK